MLYRHVVIAGGEGGLADSQAAHVTGSLGLLLEGNVEVGELDVEAGAVLQLLVCVVVPDDQVRHVGEGPEHLVLEVRAVKEVVEDGGLDRLALDVVEDGDSEMIAGEGDAGTSTLLVAAVRVAGETFLEARQGARLVFQGSEAKFLPIQLRV